MGKTVVIVFRLNDKGFIQYPQHIHDDTSMCAKYSIKMSRNISADEFVKLLWEKEHVCNPLICDTILREGVGYMEVKTYI